MKIRTLLIALPLVFGAACGDDKKEQPQDAAVEPDAGAPDASCFDLTNVATPSHEQIINACTSPAVQKVFKDSHPPLLEPNGSLPPLPP